MGYGKVMMSWKLPHQKIFSKNPELVFEFYNQRRRQLLDVKPNQGHKALVDLEKYFDVSIITQNVDNLHERAGSKNILHLHGELLKVRSVADEKTILDWNEDLNLGDTDSNGNQLRTPYCLVWRNGTHVRTSHRDYNKSRHSYNHRYIYASISRSKSS